jgi:L-ascorbate metabolism protein UlaG (beta-lactamase superfamily)
MKNCSYFLYIFFILVLFCLTTSAQFETDTINTSSGNLIITFIGHGTLMFTHNKTIIYIDPISMYAEYTTMPRADIILITHGHSDHFDKKALNQLIKPETDIVLTAECKKQGMEGIVLDNGMEKTIKGYCVKAVPAYNIIHKRGNNQPFHPKGIGNGYVLIIADKKIYIAGDTENVPEMKNLESIDIAFLPMNLPYTMTPAMVVDAVMMFHPKILYPYHYGDTNVNELIELLKDKKDCEVRIRKMQ